MDNEKWEVKEYQFGEQEDIEKEVNSVDGIIRG